MILAPGQLADLIHVILDDAGDLKVTLVGSFTALEIDIGVLRGTCLMGMLGIESTSTEGIDCIVIEELCHILILDLLDLLNLVGGAEAVKEVYEGNACLDCGEMGYECKIHDFLYGGGSEHRKAGLAASHNVTVVAENGEGVSCECTSADMEDAGKKLAGDLVHVGDHKKKALRSGESSGESTCGKGAVNCACCAALGLHFSDANLLAEKVGSALCAPFVCNLCHGRGGSDGVNGCYIGKRICNMRCSGIAINSDGLCHRDLILLLKLSDTCRIRALIRQGTDQIIL